MYYKIRYSLGQLKLRIKETFSNRRYISGQKITQNFESLLKLRKKNNGKRCFIVGNGPSLNSLDLTLLKNEHCFIFNGAYELAQSLQLQNAYLAIEDRLVLEDHATEINNLNLPRFIPSDLMHLISSDDVIETQFSRSASQKSEQWPPFVDCDASCPVFYWGGTVAYYGIELAIWMGFSEIYIIGVDLSYKIPGDVIQSGAVLLSTGDDPNHYHKNYFGAGKRWHVPQPERMHRAFETIKNNHCPKSVKIFNAGVGGNLNCFGRVKYEELFPYDT